MSTATTTKDRADKKAAELVLDIKNLESFYGPIMAIRGVSVEVRKGQIVTVLGANGAGKTTLLKTISGVMNPEKGEVLYQGIAARAFERVFQLADHVQVKAAKLENGLLHVDLKREIPEAMKPRSIEIKAAPQKAKLIEDKKAA